MSVRQSLLAILDQGPCYGYQLRHEFDRRTGSTWPLNVGQIYNTLERLERDGLVQRGEADDHGHRDASRQRLEDLRRTPSPGLAAGSPEDLAWSLVLDSLVCAAEAELRWLDQAEARLAHHPHPEMALELTTERPKRGRPAKAAPSPVAGGDPVALPA
ncbi:unnamed protein product [Penicillium discolor]